MFTQRFRLPLSGGAGSVVLPVTWRSPRDGEVVVVSVAGTPARDLLPKQLAYVVHACGQRMGECGEHRHEPEEE